MANANRSVFALCVNTYRVMGHKWGLSLLMVFVEVFMYEWVGVESR